MQLSTRSRYGCRAMLELALRKDEGPVQLEELAGSQHIPERYLSKIVQDLRRAGLVRSVRGAHGGYVLSRHPSEVNLLQIVGSMEGSLAPVECVDAPEVCEMRDQCVTRELWSRVQGAIRAVLEETLLEDLAKRHRRKAKARA